LLLGKALITGTGRPIIMEGYLNLRIQPWVRRIYRLIAIVPAVIVITILAKSDWKTLDI
jgi:manganese transport protein